MCLCCFDGFVERCIDVCVVADEVDADGEIEEIRGRLLCRSMSSSCSCAISGGGGGGR